MRVRDDDVEVRTEIGTTVLGRMRMLVTETDGVVEEVTRERRFGDVVAARSWLEQLVDQLAPGTVVEEVLVNVERWRAPRPWETLAGRPRTETIQVGVVQAGAITWASPLSAVPRAGSRHVP